MLSDLRQSEEWARYLSNQGWKVEKLPITNYFRPKGENAIKSRDKLPISIFIRKIPFLGSVIKIQRPSVMPPVKTIDKIAQKHHALFVKLEPLALPCRQAGISHKPLAGFEPDKNPNLSTKTIIIDLTKSEEELWRDLSQDARQSIRKARNYQLPITNYQFGSKEFNQALESFSHLLRRTGKRQGFWTPNLDQLKSKAGIFGKNTVLFLAYPPSPRLGGATEGQVPPVPDQPIAGALNLTHDGISYGCYAASSNRGREFHAPYLLIWEIVKRTKSLGLRVLDLEGIYDPRYHKLTKRWQGFTIFKRKFGGDEVEYPPPLIKYYHPLIKVLFNIRGIF